MKSYEITLDKAKVADIQAIILLLKSTNLTIEGVSGNIANFLVARDLTGQIIGVAGLEVYGESGLLRSVAVSPEHRGEGIGHLLVERCIGESRKQGVQRLYLLTETAEKFMERFGFGRISKESVDAALQVSEEFRGACPDTAVTMLLNV